MTAADNSFSTATVTINVTAVNDLPIAVNDGGNAAFTTNEETTLVVAAANSILNNDFDVDGPQLLTAHWFRLRSAWRTQLQPQRHIHVHAGLEFQRHPHVHVPRLRWSRFKQPRHRDDHGQSGATDPPVANNDTGYNLPEDGTLTVTVGLGVLINDTDVEFNPLTATLATQPAHGTVVLGVNGSFTYMPAANFNGAESFTYRAFDGIAFSNMATVTINVAAVNDTPIAANDSYTVTEDATLVVATPGVLANDTDVEGNALTVFNPSSVIYLDRCADAERQRLVHVRSQREFQRHSDLCLSRVRWHRARQSGHGHDQRRTSERFANSV